MNNFLNKFMVDYLQKKKCFSNGKKIPISMLKFLHDLQDVDFAIMPNNGTANKIA